MKEGESFQDFPAYVERSSSKSKVVLVVVVIVLIIAVILIGLYFLGAQNKKSATHVAPAPTHAATPTLSPTLVPSGSITPSPSGKISPSPTKSGPTPTSGTKTSLDRSNLHVAVLNGSGVSGAAKGISSYLNGLGYTILTIGNADAFTYQNITIKVKKSKSDYLPVLKKDVAADAPSTPISASVDDTITTDAEVIVGK